MSKPRYQNIKLEKKSIELVSGIVHVIVDCAFQVNKDFVELEKEIKEIHPKLVIQHGGAEKTERVKPKPRVS